LKRLLEICIDDLQSGLNAEEGGADRIELCSALDQDGLSPSFELAQTCLDRLTIPIFPMIRPRGGDFVYSDEEIKSMIEDIHRFKAMGVHGLVFGVLQSDGQIDKRRTAQLIQAAAPLPITFHRAFDRTPDPFSALRTLIELDVDRVLTSGQKGTALEGKSLLSDLVEQASDQIIIMPGAGVSSGNIQELLETGAIEYHGALKAGRTKTNIEEVKKVASILFGSESPNS